MAKNLTNVEGFIYKITSPNKKIYIGQTLNWYKRKSHYKNDDFKQQIKLWNNCKKHNWKPSDTFEIIETCLCGKDKCYLNEREKYWINYYDSFKKGLNCNEGGNGNTGHKHSKKTRKKMSIAQMGMKHTPERNAKKSKLTKGRRHSEETKKLMSETKLKNMNEKTKNKIRIGLMGNKNGIGNAGSPKKVICLTNGVVYDSIKMAAEDLKVCGSNIVVVCKGKKEHTKGFKFQYYEK